MMREGDACVALLRSKLHGLLERNRTLEEENKQLRHQVSRLKGQVSSLEGQDNDKRMLWKKLENSTTSISYSKEKQFVQNNEEAKEAVDLNNSLCYSRQQFSRTTLMRSRAPRVPNPPPSPTCIKPVINVRKEGCMAPPPPPPPLPSKLQRSTKAVQRVPEVVELYRSLVRREGKNDSKSGSAGTPVATNSREMIGEIENRSAYVLAFFIGLETSEKIWTATKKLISEYLFHFMHKGNLFLHNMFLHHSKLLDSSEHVISSPSIHVTKRFFTNFCLVLLSRVDDNSQLFSGTTDSKICSGGYYFVQVSVELESCFDIPHMPPSVKKGGHFGTRAAKPFRLWLLAT
ncbi:uncharacterized protein LOC133916315 isoform X2 [Phragmites australis]|uniref:uncharacterized protein LOC133916315 isoform X2 n=1 Tax=Phragmites australis TaxID=29695 RepID=UPI002D79F027|nr:uncharacterized protein LOC133916315 isoform X2 [Phragmites australis]